MKTLLITGTDTDVGKTVFTTSLAAYWQTYYQQKSLGLMKLMQTGLGDKEKYRQLFGNNSQMEIVTPLSFATPVAPPIAAAKEGKNIPLEKVWQALFSLQQEKDLVLLEALGGLGSPVTHELIVADLAAQWRLDTVLVVPVKLGAIASIMANVALARLYKINLVGIVLSCVQSVTEEEITHWTPIDLIESLSYVPVLGILPHIHDLDDLSKLTAVAANLNLEKFLF